MMELKNVVLMAAYKPLQVVVQNVDSLTTSISKVYVK